MLIELREQGFDAYQELVRFEQCLPQGQRGAAAHFIGSMRDQNEGNAVVSMQLEHYPGMTEKHLQQIVAAARQRWNLLDVLVLHRIGDIHIDDNIVLVGVWSAHRLDAFEACRFIMEDLKSKAPFWKKEQLTEGSRWVEQNTAGYSKDTSTEP